jgi:Abnormal spindle-like microcephaly-assoc'd, ASPM-SPD-2-Hydin
MALALAMAAAPARADTVRFGYTGAEQTYVVPPGVFGVHVVAVGGHGGAGRGGAPGGRGAVVAADFLTFPGNTLYVKVGAPGADYSLCCSWAFSNGGAGGFGAAGNGGGGGGGFTEVRSDLRAIAPYDWVTAGGGGGGGGSDGSQPGGAGGDAGADGKACGGAECGAGGRANASIFLTDPAAGGAGAGAGADGADGVGGKGGDGGAVAGSNGGAGGGGGAGMSGGGGGGAGDTGSAGAGGGGGGGRSGALGLPVASAALDDTGVSSATISPLLPTADAVSALTFAGQRLATSATQMLTIHNAGRGTLDLLEATITGPGRRDFQADVRDLPCGSVLADVAPGASCNVPVRFSPTKAGPREAVLRITSNAPSSPTTVVLHGTGTTTKPVVSALRMSASAFRAGQKTVVSYRADVPGTVTFRVLRVKAAKRRTKLIPVGVSFSHGAHAGINRFGFTGRVRQHGRMAKLPPGRYRLRAIGRNDAGDGRSAVIGFRIVRSR